LLVGQSVRRCL